MHLLTKLKFNMIKKAYLDQIPPVINKEVIFPESDQLINHYFSVTNENYLKVACYKHSFFNIKWWIKFWINPENYGPNDEDTYYAINRLNLKLLEEYDKYAGPGTDL